MFSDTSIEQYSEFIKEKAKSIGFDLVGIANVEEFNQEFSHFQEWINAGYHGSMIAFVGHASMQAVHVPQ